MNFISIENCPIGILSANLSFVFVPKKNLQNQIKKKNKWEKKKNGKREMKIEPKVV